MIQEMTPDLFPGFFFAKGQEKFGFVENLTYLCVKKKIQNMTDEEKIAVITARKEGKAIEINEKGRSTLWEPCPDPMWDFVHFDYRIKPEPHYRPFKSSEEVMEAIKEHGSWVCDKEGRYYNIVEVYDFGINIGTQFCRGIMWSQCVGNITFADGTPFGVKED